MVLMLAQLTDRTLEATGEAVVVAVALPFEGAAGSTRFLAADLLLVVLLMAVAMVLATVAAVPVSVLVPRSSIAAVVAGEARWRVLGLRSPSRAR